jgi:hypothetical protein
VWILKEGKESKGGKLFEFLCVDMSWRDLQIGRNSFSRTWPQIIFFEQCAVGVGLSGVVMVFVSDKVANNDGIG